MRMRKLIRTATAVFVGLAVSTGAAVAGPPAVAARQHVDIDSFLTGLACIESSGRFHAVNRSTGAFGKYQVMPRNWVSWSGRYLHNKWAVPNARNQEYVVRMRVSDLRSLPRTWRQVAHWWLTGNASADENLWSRGSLGYVNRVLGTARAAAMPSVRASVPQQCFPADVPPAHVRTKPWPRVTVTGRRVNLREGAGAQGNHVVGTVKRGTNLAVLGRAKDANGKKWLRVGLKDGTTAWIASWFTAPKS
jgi:hypothetical protein